MSAPATPVLSKEIRQRAHGFAGLVVHDEIQRRGWRPDDGRRAGMVAAVVAAVLVFLNVRRTRLPRLTVTLLTRFADDRLPRLTVRALRHTATATAQAFDAQRTLFSHCTTFAPVSGLATRRTTQQAHAAGFPSVEAWVESISTRRPSAIERYREALAIVARRMAREHCRGAFGVAPDRILGDLMTEAQSAIGEFLAVRMARFPRLTARLLERFTTGDLPRALDRRMRRDARRAIRDRTRVFMQRGAVAVRGFEPIPAAPAPVRKDGVRSGSAAHDAILASWRAQEAVAAA